MSSLTVLYDPELRVMPASARMAEDQPKLVELNLVPIKSDEARKRFPQLKS